MQNWMSLTSTQIDRAPNGGVIWNLQILRAIAALMVLTSHLYTEVSQRPQLTGSFNPLRPVWLPGGVDIFFIVSGFIMATITRRSFGQRGAINKFVKARLIRLVPPYWFFTGLMLGAMILLPQQISRHDWTWSELVTSLLFIPHLGPDGKVFPILELGYTLNSEVLFYLVVAAGLLFKRSTGIALIVAVLLGLVSMGLLRPVALPLPLSAWTDPIYVEFLFGIGLAEIYASHLRLPSLAGLLVAAFGVGWMVAVQYAGVPGTHYPLRFIWAGLPALLLCAGLVLQPNLEQPGPVRRIMAQLGDASYTLYLSHPFAIGAVAAVGTRLGLRSGWSFFIVTFVAAVVAALILYRGVERPIHEWLRARLAGQPQRVSKGPDPSM